jgi:hypothetical protein
MSDPLEPRIVGVPWCREEDYDTFRNMVVDPDNLRPTWNEFVAVAEETEEFQKAEGRIVERVDIDPHAFQRWCQTHGCRIDTHAMRRFAYRIAVSRHPDDGQP